MKAHNALIIVYIPSTV